MVCACTDGYVLSKTGTCVKDENYVPVSPCSSEFFQCNAHNFTICIPNEDVCDGAKDCPDGSDELAEKG